MVEQVLQHQFQEVQLHTQVVEADQHIYQVLEVLEDQVVVEMVVNIPITQQQQMEQLTQEVVQVVTQDLQILQVVQA
jgi:hypothetical protein